MVIAPKAFFSIENFLGGLPLIVAICPIPKFFNCLSFGFEIFF